MRILGIESSCDDTSLALLEASDAGFSVIAQKTASQVEMHSAFGGVVPEVAGRMHAEAIFPVLEAVLAGQDTPDVIAVTAGPGLITSLLVGVELARSLAYHWNVPLIPVNHIEGHIHSVLLGMQKNALAFPALCLVVSGGHTELILMDAMGRYRRIGATRDDAAGECFDKVAKLLGLEYPGGPKISKLAMTGNPNAIPFPRPMLDSDNFDFSFAGLKTAVLYWLRDHGSTFQATGGITREDLCASFEQAVVDSLVLKTVRAAKQYQVHTVLLAGGVSANLRLRESLSAAITHIPVLIPELAYCTDNAAMIAAAAYTRAVAGQFTSWRELAADPNWTLS